MSKIGDNYYTTIVSDSTDKETEAKIKELMKLCYSIIRAS
jgi:hypothetical protein